MKVYKTLKRLANQFHSMFHRVIYGKNPNHKADYYDAYVAYFDRRLDEIEKSVKNVEMWLDYYIKNESKAETQTTEAKVEH